ncbi:MAG TPA: hypothetical protein VKI44_30685 [Acetobacteraceae bacterium]|nr:hypothetical protein [Acetobacteraceae bacterium]
MRLRDHARMLSPGSLAAVSTGMAQLGFVQANPVHRARAVGAQPAQPGSATAPATLAPPARGGDIAPGQPLPRGSLLDLSV